MTYEGPSDQDDNGGVAGPEQRPPARRSDIGGMAQALALAGQLGFSIACPMVVFIAGGVWLDGKLNTRPLLMFVGILLGLLIAAGLIYQLTTLESRRQSRDKAGSGAPYKVEGPEGPEGSAPLGTVRADKRKRTRR